VPEKVTALLSILVCHASSDARYAMKLARRLERRLHGTARILCSQVLSDGPPEMLDAAIDQTDIVILLAGQTFRTDPVVRHVLTRLTGLTCRERPAVLAVYLRRFEDDSWLDSYLGETVTHSLDCRPAVVFLEEPMEGMSSGRQPPLGLKQVESAVLEVTRAIAGHPPVPPPPASRRPTRGMLDWVRRQKARIRPTGADTEMQPVMPELDTESTTMTGHPSALRRGAYDDAGAVEADEVDCTVYAPPEVAVGDSLMVQVHLHTPELAEQAGNTAREFDADAERRGVTSLGTRVARGSRFTFELLLRELLVEQPLRGATWLGGARSVTFGVAVPFDARVGSHIGKVLVLQDMVPIGEVEFKLRVVAEAAGQAGPGREPVGQARRYELAFISYASENRPEVLRCVRLLPAAGIRFFQDLLDLEPGDRWQEVLCSHIDESDVMLLFWSTAAKASDWVEREWRYALDHKGDDYIRPVIIEGPPPVPPPPELSHLHFDDRVAYFLRATAADGGTEAG
jgi:hypothetical protein